MKDACATIRERLGDYADGEMNGAARHDVACHLERCRPCSDALEDIRAIGDVLRARADAPVNSMELAGLASGVISRIRAEDAQSWRAVLGRATGDWHWALVGSGSVMATVLSVLVVALTCQLGAQGEREDSVAALLNNFSAPTGRMLVIATPVGRAQVRMLMQADGASDMISPSLDPQTLPAGFSGPSGESLALALADAVVRPDGRVRELKSMPPLARQQTEAILNEIQRQLEAPVATWSGQRVNVERLGFMTNAHVTSKAL